MTKDFMDMNQVLEVPDTPDRLGASATHNSDCNIIERKSDTSMSNHMVNKDCINGRMRNDSKEKGKSVAVNGTRRLFIRPNSSNNSPVSRPTIDASRNNKGKALRNSDVQKSTYKSGDILADLTEKNGHEKSGICRVNASRKGVLPLNGLSVIDSKSCKPNNTHKTGQPSDHGKGVDFLSETHKKAENSASSCMQPCTSSRIPIPRRKMLVRNGCISPLNIEKSKQVAEKQERLNIEKSKQVPEKQERGSLVKVQSGSGVPVSDGGSSIVDIKDLIADAKDSHRCKGKGVIPHLSSKEPSSGSSHFSHRGSTVAVLKSPAESERWRTTHNHRSQRETEDHKKMTIKKDNWNGKEVVNLDESDSPQTMAPHKLLDVNTSRNLGKRSLSSSSGEPSTSRPKRNKTIGGVGTSTGPDTHHDADVDPSVRARQLEADEMLARELQEQLYNEPETTEMNSHNHLALEMPLDWDSILPHVGGHHASRRQGPLVINVRENTRRPSIRGRNQRRGNASIRDPVRRLFPRPRTASSSSNRRNSLFPPNMDLDMRMEILETLEAVGDMRIPNELLQVGREFNEDDYEMLLALDEDNHRHGGATRAQINSLPESKVQAENLQECSICLETPTVGETIRHLPCLHRFHKAVQTLTTLLLLSRVSCKFGPCGLLFFFFDLVPTKFLLQKRSLWFWSFSLTKAKLKLLSLFT